MAQTTYQVTLSADGKHSITVTSDDEAAAEVAVSWAAQLYSRLARSGSQRVEPSDEDVDDDTAPICQVHQIPMVRVEGRRGAFWSCHERNPDGSYCTYRPPRRT